MASTRPPIPGTTLFDGEQARKGYALNKMCFSFNDAANRAAFKADEEAYMREVRPERSSRREAIRNRNVLGLLAAGGNVYYLAKFAGIFGLDVQDIGAAADRHEQGGVQGPAGRAERAARAAGLRPQETDHGKNHRRHHHFARARYRRRDRQGLAAGALLEAVLRRLPAGARGGWAKSSRTSPWCSTTTTA